MKIPFLNEEDFAQEVANRLNTFIMSYPKEAQGIFQIYFEYEDELKTAHSQLAQEEGFDSAPGSNFAAFICAVLQTQHGNGYLIRPVYKPDPKKRLSSRIIEKFVVVRQTDADSDELQS